MSENNLISIQRSKILNTINNVGNALKFVGVKPFKLDVNKMISKAKKNANFEGEIPANIVLGMTKLFDSIHTEGNVNPFGALATKTLFERTLTQRLLMEKHFNENPEIEKAEIKAPIFIIGMPRTGTTILHAMMHEDAANRSPLAWECLVPHPVQQPETFHDNEQLATITKEFGQLFKLVPDFLRKHHMSPVSPQECLGITSFDFNSFQTSAQVYVPSYMDWFFDEADKLGTMKFHKRFLQFLQSGGVKADRWLLKSPVHLMRLKEIFEVYPDAKIVMTHRSPHKVVASAASLISSVRSLYSDTEKPERTGAEQADYWSKSFERFLKDRKDLNKEDQIIDLKFEDFVADQVGTIQKIYDKFGMELTEDTKDKMDVFLSKNPKDVHGVHNYSLEDFGLTGEQIDSQFKNYINFINNL